MWVDGLGRSEWWQRSLDRHFRALDEPKKRDIDELRAEIKERNNELRKEAREYVEDFWKDVQERAGDGTQRTKEFREQSQRYVEEYWRDVREYTKKLKSARWKERV